MPSAITGNAFGSAGRRLAGVTAKADTVGLVLVGLFATPSSSAVFTAPVSAYYTVFGLGGGGGGSSYHTLGGGSASSAIGRRRVFLFKGQTLSITVGAGGVFSNADNGSGGGNTSIGFPDGTTMTCGGGAPGYSMTNGIAGVVSGTYDVAYSGSDGLANNPSPAPLTVYPQMPPGLQINGGWGTSADSRLPGGSGLVWVFQG